MHDRLVGLGSQSRHVVVVCGGAVSGSEAAAVLAGRGITAVVVEQNVRPYGKIEDGLPRWHDKLRSQEYARIDENLSRPGVFFVPATKIGSDLEFDDVAKRWGASAVLLANGAWRDRALPVPGAEQYLGKGLVYQNPFVYWFNHYEDEGFRGPHFEVVDDAVVIGGGLASVDVVKIINLELYRRALAQRGIPIGVVELEHRGISAVLKHHGIDASELGVRGCTLYYRRRVRDMPLAFAKTGATPEQVLKTETVREKMVGILKEKFRVRVADCQVPVAPIVEGGRMVGLRFRRTEVQNGKSVEVEGSEHEVRSGLIVSSIGSVPEPMAGVPTRGELYDYSDWNTGALRGLSGIFGLGNVLTGKGNIRDSRENAGEISEQVIADYLGLSDGARGEPAGSTLAQEAFASVRQAAHALADLAGGGAAVPIDGVQRIAHAIDARWRAVGYDGDYASWIARGKSLS